MFVIEVKEPYLNMFMLNILTKEFKSNIRWNNPAMERLSTKRIIFEIKDIYHIIWLFIFVGGSSLFFDCFSTRIWFIKDCQPLIRIDVIILSTIKIKYSCYLVNSHVNKFQFTPYAILQHLSSTRISQILFPVRQDSTPVNCDRNLDSTLVIKN